VWCPSGISFGPTLFLESVGDKILAFADDAKIYHNPLGNLNSGRAPGEQSSLEAAVATSSRKSCIH